MSNRKNAKKLRDSQAKENESNTETAMASQKETEIQADSIEKIQQELENAKLLLADTNEAKDELEQELELVKKENVSLKALVEEKQKQIDNLKASNEELSDDNGELRTENAKLKAPAKADPKKK